MWVWIQTNSLRIGPEMAIHYTCTQEDHESLISDVSSLSMMTPYVQSNSH